MGKKERLKRRRRRQSAVDDRGTTRDFKRSVIGEARAEGVKPALAFPSQPRGLPKISERLTAVAAPFASECTCLDDLRWTISLAAFAWNVSLLEKNGDPSALADLLRKGGLSFLQRFTAKKVIRELTRRKEELFPDDERLVHSWDVSMRNGEPYVQVAASVYESQLAPEVRQRLGL